MSARGSIRSQSARHFPGDGFPARGPGEAHPGQPGAEPPPVVSRDAAPRISPRCGWQVLEGEAVLLDLEGKRILGLNRVGSFVFPLLDGTRTVTGLAGAVAERFGVGRDRAESDVRVFLAELARRGFVEGVQG